MKAREYKIILSAISTLISCFTSNVRAGTIEKVAKVDSHVHAYIADSSPEKEMQADYIKVKTYTNSVPVSGNDMLQINNEYGQVVVNTWDKNEFKVEVEIKAHANSDAEAQKLLNGVKIDLQKENNNGTVIAFRTNIDPAVESWKIQGGNYDDQNGTMTSEHKLVITYRIYMPLRNPLKIDNQFGDIILPSLEGKLNINNIYGSLTAKSITNNGNVIKIKYGNVTIENLSASDLNLSVGSLNAKSVDHLNANISYSPVRIGRLINLVNINLKYKTLQIVDIDKDFKSIQINSIFAPVKIKLGPEVNADFDVTVRYTNFIHKSGVSVTSKAPANNTRFNQQKNYQGHIGNGNTDKLIIINADYGDGVEFK
ncbi:MAG TPA: hypothetical protein VL442_11680 [Mucilaginibacter sp.]|jgi:hypothetical protein|nr:hypothetical protein [Mucilaginibacter sp.]